MQGLTDGCHVCSADVLLLTGWLPEGVQVQEYLSPL